MKKLSSIVRNTLSAAFFLTVSFSAIQAVAATLSGSHQHALHPTNGHVPSAPFSGIVEGTVVATSTTSITIDKKSYRTKNGTSTEITFPTILHLRIVADKQAVSIGSFVSLIIERVGKDAGKVREIDLLPSEARAHTS